MRWAVPALLAVMVAVALMARCSRGGEEPQGGVTSAPVPTQDRHKPAKGQGSAVPQVLMVVAPRDFRDEEYQEPFTALTAAGARVTVASKSVGKATGVAGTQVEATLAAAQADPKGYDMVVFVGGPGMVAYLQDPDFIKLAQAAGEAHKRLAAICVAPAILANAGLLKGVPATSWPDQLATLKAKGAVMQSEKAFVVSARHGEIITASGPEAAKDFAGELVRALAQKPGGSRGGRR